MSYYSLLQTLLVFVLITTLPHYNPHAQPIPEPEPEPSPYPVTNPPTSQIIVKEVVTTDLHVIIPKEIYSFCLKKCGKGCEFCCGREYVDLCGSCENEKDAKNCYDLFGDMDFICTLSTFKLEVFGNITTFKEELVFNPNEEVTDYGRPLSTTTESYAEPSGSSNSYDNSNDYSYDNSKDNSYGNSKDKSNDYSYDNSKDKSNDYSYDNSKDNSYGNSKDKSNDYSYDNSKDNSYGNSYDNLKDNSYGNSYNSYRYNGFYDYQEYEKRGVNRVEKDKVTLSTGLIISVCHTCAKRSVMEEFNHKKIPDHVLYVVGNPSSATQWVHYCIE